MEKIGKLQDYLKSLAETAQPGDRLPTVRGLMRDFKISQPGVQRALQALKEEGLVDAQVGRGTFFVGSGANSSAAGARILPQKGRSVILLRRPSATQRARFVMDRLQAMVADGGDITLEVAYSNADHARRVLQSLPRFDACVIQNSFEQMPVEMLAALRRKSDNVIVDGAWLVGTDVDAVGFEWGRPVERAVRLLLRGGHQHIHYITTANSFLANELGLHRYRQIQEEASPATLLHEPDLLPSLPSREFELAVLERLAAISREPGGKQRGALVWGIESGQRLRAGLHARGIRVPEDISIVLLGRSDVEAEREGFFHLIGYSAQEQAEALYARLKSRWRDPQAPYGLSLITMHEIEGHSVLLAASSATEGPSSQAKNKPGG
ncbi:GntR family transcriptional regulator [Rhizobium sp. CC-YZS058]|uniref:GntR family transcriptional regulator n=1 Tax=Rhizobium sp. CC-YZS058 TaxID=3042153 RepID=UPI002B057604|nr:GntR family transcriptional regulator [Rhizobium sp. CC-YZS058]MEA3535860.1 GntR family transcriptional regulator [Rhizobium sp. CC-YZS058]